MTRRIKLIACAAMLGAFLASPTDAFAQNRLVANVGQNDSFTISLRTESGATVSQLAPGTYTIEVHDHSSSHNFHLTGAGVDQSTTVAFVGTTTWTVTLRAGERYTYVCDPHSTSMRGSFTTTGGSPPPPPPPPPPPRVQRLVATVGPGFTISLRTARGVRVRKLRAGRYRIVVRDRSGSHNFHLTGRGVNKRTSVGFRGTATWTLRLRRGTYRFVCDPHRLRMRGSFRVT